MIGRKGPPSAASAQKPRGFDDFELRLGDVMRGERATLGKSLLDVQRELKIKATYVAAIENCDISAFETQGFVAGYVRSYARYLGMDPEWTYDRFCREANFNVAHGMSPATSSKPTAKPGARTPSLREIRDPLADPNATFVPRGGPALFSGIERRAVGSIVVLAMLIGAIGYGGWLVLQQVQRVELAPVDQPPGAVAELDPLVNVAASPDTRTAKLSVPAADKLDQLYRPQALDVPVMVTRDGPIAAIRPGSIGALSPSADGILANVASAAPQGTTPAAAASATARSGDVKVMADAQPSVQIIAVRPAWVRVRAADGTVLFEKILDAGERYKVPAGDAPATLRAGNSGAVYFIVNGKAYGPTAAGAQVVKNVPLAVGSVEKTYKLADLNRDPDLAAAVAVAQAEPVVGTVPQTPSQ